MNQNQNALLAGLAAAFICIIVFLIFFLVLWILFCLTLQRTQTEVRPRNRLLAPGLVWLHLLHLGQGIPIPFVGPVVGLGASIWDLIMVLKLGGSLKNEFDDRGWHTDGEGFGRIVGVIWCICQLTGHLVSIGLNLVGPQIADPTIAIAIVAVFGALWLTGIVCWIIYWIQMAGYGRRLREGKRGYRRGSIEEDYDDEYRPSRRRYEDDDDDEDFGRRRRDEDDDDQSGFDFNRRSQRADDEYDEDDDRPRRHSRDDY